MKLVWLCLIRHSWEMWGAFQAPGEPMRVLYICRRCGEGKWVQKEKKR